MHTRFWIYALIVFYWSLFAMVLQTKSWTQQPQRKKKNTINKQIRDTNKERTIFGRNIGILINHKFKDKHAISLHSICCASS